MNRSTKHEDTTLIRWDTSKEVNEEDIRVRLMATLDGVEDEHKEQLLLWYLDFGKKMLVVANSCCVEYYKNLREHDKNLYMKSLERLTSDSVKKPSFTTDEVMKITNIRSKGTIIKYFKNRKIQAKQDPGGRWFVLREDLAKYVGHDNF